VFTPLLMLAIMLGSGTLPDTLASDLPCVATLEDQMVSYKVLWPLPQMQLQLIFTF